MEPRKKVRKKIEYFALGIAHIAYTSVETDDEVIEWAVSLIAPTAYVECVSTDLINDDLLEEMNLDHLITYHNKVKSYESPTQTQTEPFN